MEMQAGEPRALCGRGVAVRRGSGGGGGRGPSYPKVAEENHTALWASWGLQFPGRPAQCPCWLQAELRVCSRVSPSCLPGPSLPRPWGAPGPMLQALAQPFRNSPHPVPTPHPTPNYFLSGLFLEHLARAIDPSSQMYSSCSGDLGARLILRFSAAPRARRVSQASAFD